MKLSGHTILITGGATGIGLALAQHLLQEDNLVIICGRSDAALQKAQEDTQGLMTRVCDVADRDSRRSMVEWLEANHPNLDVVVNNAGIQRRRDFIGDAAMDTLDQEVAINLTAPIHLIAELLPMLRKQEQGLIVNITSGLAFSPMADVPVYCATKAALHSFTLSLRHQLKATAIRVVEIAPPIVDTGLGGDMRSGGVASSRMMSADNFATEALAKLAADEDEILIGISVETRRQGEALFERMNNRS